jgi:large subunit ribosomal protein L3
MGRRRTKAPRHGSLAYLPRKRASRPIGKIRYWPDVTLQSPQLIGYAGYKVGMNSIYLVHDVQGSPHYGQEVFCPVTIIETPPLFIGGIRAYTKTINGLKSLTETWAEKLPSDAEKVMSRRKHITTSLATIKEALSQITELRAIVFTQPRLASVPQKKPELLEVKITGGTKSDQLTYIEEKLGHTIEITEVFQDGQYIDVIGITKGKGVQGPVKRWGVKILPHKSRKTVRGIGTLGPWSPHYVMYTVPRAGQMGFHQRTERNKRILQIQSNGTALNPQSGFPHYGLVKAPCILVKGSIPGPVKRLLKFRYATNAPQSSPDRPKITQIGLSENI